MIARKTNANQPRHLSIKAAANRPRPLQLESLEKRCLLAAGLGSDHDSIVDAPSFASAIASGESQYRPHDVVAAVSAINAITTTGSDAIASTGPVPGAITPSGIESSGIELTQSTLRILLDQFRADARFAGIDGSGFSTVIIDTGIDLDHPHFGPDADSDGIADRIVHQQSFLGLPTADDSNGHGTHVAGTAASGDGTLTGMAPAAGIIALQTNNEGGSGRFSDIERALQWVVANVATHNIASVNMSLGDSSNYAEAASRYGLGDELAALAALDVIVVSASGNSNGAFTSPGVAYPSSDPNSLSIGSRRTSAFSPSGFSQRHPELTTIFAPGDPITAAWPGGGTRSIGGTSMASPHVAGIAVLMQELAVQEIGRRLTLREFETLVRSSGVDLFGIPSTGASYQSLDVLAFGESILAMAGSATDLAGSNFSVSSGLVRGEAGSASITLQNLGATNSGPVAVDFYLSTNSNISDTGDLHLGQLQFTDVSGSGTSTEIVNFTLPDPNDEFWTSSETYTIGAVIDLENTIGESDEANNLNVAIGLDKATVDIANPPSDLLGQSFAILEPIGVRGQSITVGYSIANAGVGPTEASTVEFYLSADGIIDPAVDVLLGSQDIGRVLAGGVTDDSERQLDLPPNADPFWQAAGPYTIGMLVDALDTETESNEINNRNVGDGFDLQSLEIVTPPSTLRGTVFQDKNGDGVASEPFREPVRFSQGAGGLTIRPSRVTTFDFTDLPATAGSASLRVQAIGDIDEVSEFATITIDGVVAGTVFDKEPLETTGFFATGDETLVLEGQDWLDAIADGDLSIELTFTNPGGFSTGSSNWMRVTLDYDGESTERYYEGETVENRVLNSRDTTVTFDASQPPVGDGRLTLFALGDVGGTEENAVVDLEGIASFTLLGNSDGTGDMAGASESVVVPLATLQQLLADGQITAGVDFGGPVDNFFSGNFFELRLDYPIDVEQGVGGVDVQLDVSGDGSIDQVVTTLFDDPSTAINESGTYEFVDVGSGQFDVSILPPIGTLKTAPAGLGYSETLIEGQLVEGLDFGVMGAFVPSVESVVVENGAVSRSQVTSVEVTFNGRIDPSLLESAITLTNTSEDIEVTGLLIDSQFVGGQTVATLSFNDGASVATRSGGGDVANSLDNGNYKLDVLASGIVSNLGQAMAEDYSFGESATDNFFRYYGDSDGDRDVDGQDYGRFGLAFLKSAGQPGFDSQFDSDGDDDVDGQDYGRFGLQFLTTLSFS